MNDRSLHAWINSEEIGRLRERNGIWEFQYTENWIDESEAYELSPHLPLTLEPYLDESTNRPVQWYFDNLLPEEGQRTLLAKDAKVNSADAFGLLTHYGAESAGSLTLLESGSHPASEGELLPLTDIELERRINNLPGIPLVHSARKRMSLAGAQHKLAIVVKSDELFEPTESMPSTHILKPDNETADYPHSVINEWFTMLLAGKLGLRIPNITRRYVPSPLYIIERFDRAEGADWPQRVHSIDACQLLGLDRTFKYSEGCVDVLEQLASYCRSPAVVRTQLYSWLVFNLLVGNTDAHLKNLSFLISNEGISLAPFYDILSTAYYETQGFPSHTWPNETELSWPIFDVKHCSDVDRSLMVKVAQTIGINKTTALRLLDHQTGIISAQASKLLETIEQENSEYLRSRPELGLIFEGEMRCLRGIVHIIIMDMVEKLK